MEGKRYKVRNPNPVRSIELEKADPKESVSDPKSWIGKERKKRLWDLRGKADSCLRASYGFEGLTRAGLH
jgi:hypothetical protein